MYFYEILEWTSTISVDCSWLKEGSWPTIGPSYLRVPDITANLREKGITSRPLCLGQDLNLLSITAASAFSVNRSSPLTMFNMHRIIHNGLIITKQPGLSELIQNILVSIYHHFLNTGPLQTWLQPLVINMSTAGLWLRFKNKNAIHTRAIKAWCWITAQTHLTDIVASQEDQPSKRTSKNNQQAWSTILNLHTLSTAATWMSTGHEYVT